MYKLLGFFFLCAAVAFPVGAEERIYFSSNRDAEKGKLHFSIYSMTADGKDVKRITDGKQNAFDPAISPDGKKLAYVVAERDADPPTAQIWTMKLDGSDKKNLTPKDEFAFAPAWSPDGGRLAYSTQHDIDQRTIMVAGVDGGKTTEVTDGIFPSWSRDGKSLIYGKMEKDKPVAPHTIDLADPKPVRVGKPGESADSWSEQNRWSPDGADLGKLLNTAHFSGLMISYDKGEKTRKVALDYAVERILAFQWSADGKQLFVCHEPPGSKGSLKSPTVIRAITPFGFTNHKLTDGKSCDLLSGAFFYLWDVDRD